MGRDNYITRRRIMILGALAVAFGGISSFVKLEWWPFLTLLVEGGILYFVIHEVVSANRKERKKMKQLQNTDVRYLVPQAHYRLKEYNGAPPQESYPKALTIGIGNYNLLLELKSEIDIRLDPLVLLFEGEDLNRPRFRGKYNPFIVETLKDGSYRNWHDDVSHASEKYPKYLYQGDVLLDGNLIETIGQWDGSLHIRIPIQDAQQVDKYLKFAVSPEKDDVPWLRITDTIDSSQSGVTANVANTTKVDKAKW